MDRNISRIYKNKIYNIDYDYESVDEMHKNINKKEPYIFTVTSVNYAGSSLPSDPTPDTNPIISPLIKSVTAVASKDINNTPIATLDIIADERGSPITSLNIVTGNSTLKVDTSLYPDKKSSSNTTGLNYSELVISPETSNYKKYSFNIYGLIQGYTYSFNVTATSIDISESLKSNSIVMLSLPPAPIGISIQSLDKECKIFFTPLYSVEPIIDYTVVYESGEIATTGTSSPILVKGLTNGTTYRFKIKSRNSVGFSSLSELSPPVTPSGKPTPPTIITAKSNQNGQSEVSFSGQDNNGDNITKYTVTAMPGSIEATNTTGSPIIVTGLTNGVNYTFSVTVTNKNGSSTSTVTSVAKPATTPDKITNLENLPGTKLITLKFQQPNTGGDPIKSYNINAYYTDKENSSITTVEKINIPVTSSNYSIDNNIVTIKLYTKTNAIFKQGSVIENPKDATINTISLNELYDRVPLSGYPVGNERKSKKCYILPVIFIVLFFLIIYWMKCNKQKSKKY